MASNPRSTLSERNDLGLIRNDRNIKAKPSNTIMRRLTKTLVALALLATVLVFLSPRSRNRNVQAGQPSVLATPDDVRLGSVQMSKAIAGEALYLDGVITNTGQDPITGVTVAIDFHDAKGDLAGSVQTPIAGMTHGGTDLIRNEFSKNPIQPNEMRFFRVAVEQIPPGWNYQVPELKVVAVNAQ